MNLLAQVDDVAVGVDVDGVGGRCLAEPGHGPHVAALVRLGAIQVLGQENTTVMPIAHAAPATLPKVMRRQLRAAGFTFQSLLDELRYREARRYLGSTKLTVQSIARQLGYADARSFRTAFRRWSGQTPAEYRGQ